jgi:glycolate oxidase iron-sulfur subunit
MQITLAVSLHGSAHAEEAARIVRSCVHCGFCNAACPTYQLLGDELDGPRGRIYQMKRVLEGEAVSERTQLHLDRCLGCRACESVCPSGVEYGRLLDLGRELVQQRVPRTLQARTLRSLLRGVLTDPRLFAPLLRIGRLLRPLLPSVLRRRIPLPKPTGEWPPARHPRRMLTLAGCVQSSIAPRINAASARVLDRVGISLLEPSGTSCCGAIDQHLDAGEQAAERARRAIDAWWPEIERGVEAIVVTASGCGLMVKEYARLLSEDPRYAARAARVSALTRDLVEVVAAENPAALRRAASTRRIAVQTPCTLQHGLRCAGMIETVLRAAGFELTQSADAHLCCGSAGTYSILQPVLAGRLLDNKLRALNADNPDCIVSANIGCLVHLQSRADIPVRHWIELLD